MSRGAAQWTGDWTYASELMCELGRRPEAVRLEVLTNEHAWDELSARLPDTIEVRRARGYRVGNRRAGRLVALGAAALWSRRFERQLSDDIELVHYPLTLNVPPVRRPRVMTLHDVQHHDLPGAFTAAQRLWRSRTYDEAARRATFVVTDSDHARSRIIDLVGVDPDRIATVPLGVDHGRFQPERAADDERRLDALGLPPRFILYPASLWMHKNHERLLEALARTSDPDLALVLTGATFAKLDWLLDRVAAIGLSGRVLHHGRVDEKTLPALYRAALALVFPSRYEGFGAPPVEAMACGCPVASTTCGSLREVCGTAVSELDPDDPEQMAKVIDEIADDRVLRDALRERGFVQARRFTWARSADLLLSAYSQALDRGHGVVAGRSQ